MKNNLYEREVVQPATLRLLIRNFPDAIIRYEYRLTNGRHPDFVVFNNPYTYLFECKRDCQDISTSCWQVCEYREVMGENTICALVAPTSTITPKARKYCDGLRMFLLGVDVDEFLAVQLSKMGD